MGSGEGQAGELGMSRGLREGLYEGLFKGLQGLLQVRPDIRSTEGEGSYKS